MAATTLRIFWVLGAMCTGVFLHAQTDTSVFNYFLKDRNLMVPAIVVEGDTIPVVILDEVLLVASSEPTFVSDEARKKYYQLRRKVIKVYPWAVKAAMAKDTLDARLARAKNKRERKRITKEYQEELEQKFEPELRKLTRSEGQILNQLVYRETGITTYDLISEYRSSWTAFWYNVTANYYDISLKKKYDPESDPQDKLVEQILQRSFRLGLLAERKKK
jgi:hypothetical protein